MADSASRRPFGFNPFEKALFTPGPLGCNDAASPDSFFWIRKDTPGPLGSNDHADPEVAAKRKEEIPEPVGPLPKLMNISQAGLDFIWNEEYVGGISEKLHWPGGASGVTLGAGYDMKARTANEVSSDLLSIGIDYESIGKASLGAGLVGQDAKDFVHNNKQLLSITDAQATKLLNLIIPGYASRVQKSVKVCVLQHQFDALVSFAYNPGGRFGKVANLINKNDVNHAMFQVKAANTSGGKVLPGLVTRREHEVNLYLNGTYES